MSRADDLTIDETDGKDAVLIAPVWGAQRANPVYRARYQHLTGREISKLSPTQA